ncbi:Ferrichrome-iron receptor precursor [Pigmentiphaga humi]|uniref:Ferrichrome-iron receptor n=1 Tax=Pigmentiphaga humi TaxID=2478468 RepID=A0A3P4B2Y3_9BURK|nr:TonB-dependent siderophore receptor [Pigmentiphaga humi]VCU70070.1 Ferrichrome-iron receptor precursor [Pigmentiphaga humi]
MQCPRFRAAPSLLALALAVGIPAHAADVAGPASINIASQPLGQALNQLARQTRLELMVQPELVAGRTAPSVAGTFTAQQALERLLAGSGLVGEIDGNIVTITRGAAADTTMLAPVTVVGQAEAETATSPVDGYVARRSLVGTKTDTPIIETPQSISVVTRDALDAQGTLNVGTALRYTAGVGPAAYSNGDGNAYDAITLRGFVVSNAGLLRDGMRLNYNILDAPNEAYGLDRVEILKGPASVVFGQSGPSGVVNLVSKRPQPEARHEIEAQLGSYDRRQLATDHTGALNDDGTLYYRLTGLVRESDSYVDFNRDDRAYIAPALTWQPSAQTRFTLLTHYQRSKSAYYGGLPYSGTIRANPLGSPSVHANLGEPDFNYWDTTSKSAGYLAEHTFDNGWQLRQSLRYSESSLRYGYVFPVAVAADNRTVSRQAVRRSDESTTWVADTNLQRKWQAFGGEHTTLLGVDYGRSHFSTWNYRGAVSPIDMFDPVYGGLNGQAPALALRNHDDVRAQQVGVYAQQQSRFMDRWVVTVGGRQDWARSTTTSHVAGTVAKKNDHAFSGRLGLTYLAPGGIAPYVSYAESFEPLTGTYYDGTPFKPTEGRQYEAGIKYQPEGSRTLVTLAVYDLVQRNVSTRDPDQVNHPGGLVQTGEIRSKGIELEAAGEIARNLRLRAALTLNDAKVTQSNNPVEIGRRPADTPRRMASLWLDYRLADTALSGLVIGGGARYVGSSFDAANSAQVPGRTLYDLMLGYELARWKFTFNVINVFDKRYLTSCYASTACLYGPPRTAMLTARYAW